MLSLSSFPSSLANCPVAVYSVSAASSSLFGISLPQSSVTSLTEMKVGEPPLFLHGLFSPSTHSHTTQRDSSPPPPCLRPLVSCFVRSLLTGAPPPADATDEGGWGPTLRFGVACSISAGVALFPATPDTLTFCFPPELIARGWYSHMSNGITTASGEVVQKVGEEEREGERMMEDKRNGGRVRQR
ncbi:hypothetical protein FQA47_012561 [Oryzias melastigma]|uniref:Uncharacterized protein n=1 Tax=Oryzias melastigma TaxID=30732 RepID=A0A834EWU0_ORYME|nr:hypothetical protein FQA47_012561 [Oryzias melastigma]